MHLLAALVCGLIGIVAGSELELVIRRAPMRLRLRTSRHCGRCGTPVQPAQRFGLWARIVGRNRCRTCHANLWSPVPWVPIAVGVVLATFGARFGWATALPAYLVFAAALVAITAIDFRHYLIPTRIVRPAFLVCAAWLAMTALVDGSSSQLVTALIGAACAGGFFFVVWLVHPRGMGFGDVRLATLIGLMSGWIGLGNVVLAVMLGLLAGSVVGVLLMLARIRGRKDAIPYGPFLVAGAFAAILFGADLQQWWTGGSNS